MKKSLAVSVLAAAMLLAGCQSVNTTSGGAVGVERKQYMFSMLSSQEVDQMYAQLYTGLPGVKLVRIDGSYHFIMLDQPQRFAGEVQAFLR